MYPAQLPPTNPGEPLRCRDSSRLIADEQMSRNEITQGDAALTDKVDNALWKEPILRALDYHNIEIRVTNRIVDLYGHVLSLANGRQAEVAVRSVGGVAG